MRNACLVLAFVCLPSFAAHASPLGDLFDDTAGGDDALGAPYFVVRDANAELDPLPLREVAVHADISGVVADVTMTQLWENTGATPISATYVFPLSSRSAVHALEMRVGGRRIVATIKEREAARKTFEDAKAKGLTATLLEQDRPNLFTSEIANVQPGEVIEVELRYFELLRPTDGIYSWVVPKVVGPRYVSPQEADPELPWSAMATTRERPEPVLHAWQVSATIDGGVPVQWAASGTHAIALERDGDRLAVDLAEDDPEVLQDFVLDYALGSDALETGVLVAPDADGDGGHFLALVAPPARVDPALVPRRDYVFIVDTSGSMEGWPLGIAKAMIGDIVDGLDADDSVNVLCFSGDADALSPQSLPATPANKARARAFLDRQRGGGGTELLGALRTAFATPPIPGRARTFVVVTDGFVSVEAAAIDLIRAQTNRATVFGIGIGDGVNRYLLDAIAAAGQGEPYIALDEAAARDVAERFLDEARAPVLTDLAVTFDGVDAYDVEPAALPNLYAERPVLVSGRYRGPATGSLTIHGTSGAGPWRRTLSFAGGEHHPAVPILWARERIARLSDFAGAADAPNHQIEVTALGLEYSLVTAFTSFVAVDEAGGEVATGEPEAPSAGEGMVLGHGSAGMGFSGTGMGGSGSGIGRIGGLGDIDGGLGTDSGGAKPAPAPSLKVQIRERGRVAAADVASMFRRRVGAVRACLASDPTLASGKLSWRVTFDASGKASAASLVAGTLAEATRACVERLLLRVVIAAGARVVDFDLDVAAPQN